MSVVWQTRRENIDRQTAADIDQVLGAGPFQWAVYRGWASSEAQAELYKKYLAGGPMAAPPGHSAHECIGSKGEPAALAVDVVRVTQYGNEVWDYATHPAWPWLWQAIRSHERLHSGHEFPQDTGGRAKRDDDHIQSQISWLAYKAALIKAGRW